MQKASTLSNSMVLGEFIKTLMLLNPMIIKLEIKQVVFK